MERDVAEVDVDEFKKKKDTYVIIDCREEAEYKDAHIDGSRHIFHLFMSTVQFGIQMISLM
jgi:rhodanese-related sulfurtransferase